MHPCVSCDAPTTVRTVDGWPCCADCLPTEPSEDDDVARWRSLDGQAEAWVWCVGEKDDRFIFRWSLRSSGVEVAAASDLSEPARVDVGAAEALCSLASFLAAFHDARRFGSPDSGCWDLFPESVVDWADAYADGMNIALNYPQGGS